GETPLALSIFIGPTVLGRSRAPESYRNPSETYTTGRTRCGSLRAMTDRLDVVAVEVDDEGAVVVGMILRPQPRRAVVSPARRPVASPARRQSRLVEGPHLGPGIDRERDVHGRLGLSVAPDPELGFAALAEAARPDLSFGLLRAELHHEGNPERCKRPSVERL